MNEAIVSGVTGMLVAAIPLICLLWRRDSGPGECSVCGGVGQIPQQTEDEIHRRPCGHCRQYELDSDPIMAVANARRLAGMIFSFKSKSTSVRSVPLEPRALPRVAEPEAVPSGPRLYRPKEERRVA